VLVTRVDPVIAAAVDVPGAEHDERARLLTWRPAAAGDFTVAVVTAGTSADLWPTRPLLCNQIPLTCPGPATRHRHRASAAPCQARARAWSHP
jgi:hypothetical protein